MTRHSLHTSLATLADKTAADLGRQSAAGHLLRVVLPLGFTRSLRRTSDDGLFDEPDDAARRNYLLSRLLALGLEPERARSLLACVPPAAADPIPVLMSGILTRLQAARDGSDAVWLPLRVTSEPGEADGAAPLEKLRESLLPELVDALFIGDPSQPDAPKVTWLRMAPAAQARRFGRVLSVSRGRDADRKPAIATTALEAVDLVVATTGIAVLLLDLHVVHTHSEDAAASPWRPLDRAMLRCVDALQYLPSRYRRTVSPSFGQGGAPLVAALLRGELPAAAAGPLLAHVRTVLQAWLAEAATGANVENLHPAPEERRWTAFAKAAAGLLAGQLLAELGVTAEGAGSEASRALAARFDGSAVRRSQADPARDAAIRQALERLAGRLRAAEPPPEYARAAAGDPALQSAWSRIGPVLAARIEVLPEAIGPDTTDLGTPAPRWGYEDLLRAVLRDAGLGAPLAEGSDATALCDALVVGGDRAMIFSHRYDRDAPAVSTQQADLELAHRLARRHDVSHDPPLRLATPDIGDGAEASDGVRVFQGFRSIRYTMALEGVAVDQVGGSNPHFHDDTHVVRTRHFALVLLALLSRATLLQALTDLMAEPVGRRPTGGENVDDGARRDRARQAITQLEEQVAEYTRALHHVHVSQMTHLQRLYATLREVFELDGLWSSVHQNLAALERSRFRILERAAERIRQQELVRLEDEEQRRRHEERKAERRRQRLATAGAILAGGAVVGAFFEFFLRVKGFVELWDAKPWSFFAASTLVGMTGVGLALLTHRAGREVGKDDGDPKQRSRR